MGWLLEGKKQLAFYQPWRIRQSLEMASRVPRDYWRDSPLTSFINCDFFAKFLSFSK
jgi:hypothetical protein